MKKKRKNETEIIIAVQIVFHSKYRKQISTVIEQHINSWMRVHEWMNYNCCLVKMIFWWHINNNHFATIYSKIRVINITRRNSYVSRASQFIPRFLWGSCCSIFSFIRSHCYVYNCLSFSPFVFSHYFLCPHSINDFWLPFVFFNYWFLMSDGAI